MVVVEPNFDSEAAVEMYSNVVNQVVTPAVADVSEGTSPMLVSVKPGTLVEVGKPLVAEGESVVPMGNMVVKNVVLTTGSSWSLSEGLGAAGGVCDIAVGVPDMRASIEGVVVMSLVLVTVGFSVTDTKIGLRTTTVRTEEPVFVRVVVTSTVTVETPVMGFGVWRRMRAFVDERTTPLWRAEWPCGAENASLSNAAVSVGSFGAMESGAVMTRVSKTKMGSMKVKVCSTDDKTTSVWPASSTVTVRKTVTVVMSNDA